MLQFHRKWHLSQCKGRNLSLRFTAKSIQAWGFFEAARDFTLVIAHKYKMPLSLFDHLCLGIFTLYLPTGKTSTLWNFPSWKTGKVPPTLGEMKSHGRLDSSLTPKIPLWCSRNIAGSLCCPKAFHLKEQFMRMKFHFCSPLSLSSDTTTAGRWQSWVWLWRFMYCTRGEVLIWEWFWFINYLDLNDLEVGPRIFAQLSKCLCKLLSHTVPYHFTSSATAFAWKSTPPNYWRLCKVI